MSILRITGAAGFACAALLVLNAGRKGGLVPETVVTGAVAPFAPLTGLFAVTGIYLLIRHRSGTLGLVGYLLNSAGLAGAFGIEFTLHYVFPYLPGDTVAGLVAGGTGKAFLVTGVVLITGVLALGAAALRSRALPAAGVALYVIGMIPGSLRSAVPLPVYLVGLVVAAAGIALMAARLWSAQEEGGGAARIGGAVQASA
ncbi:hypothetical protein [Planomonospora sp. ID82291]|uniref:hypothetical protein n=1 Tax=Planomonospora sp. ID82291 TaxID=2738136 RepID=UPI0018C42AC7|nr:hypothetical protein [Planomonospora sp. ID82291]MBG0814076.1 hypothetical protein [Planomonospora sp. ID82291]